MTEWEKDYAEFQGQMLAGKNISFDKLIQELRRTVDAFNHK